MSLQKCIDLINSDFIRLVNKRRTFIPSYRNSLKSFIIEYFRDESLNFTVWFRICNYLQNKLYRTANPLVKLFLRIIYWLCRVIYTLKQRTYGIILPIGTTVGKGLRFEHYGGIAIAACAVIGTNCTIFQNVTIGRNFAQENQVPTIGNNVVIFAGAKVVGGCKIANEVVIACGAIVIADVADGCTVAGCPAKVVSSQVQSIKGNWRLMFSLDN